MVEQESQFVPGEEEGETPKHEIGETSETKRTEAKKIDHAEKMKVWQETREEVARMVDKLDEPVDEGIKEGVVALRVNGFETNASCEGHVDRGDHGKPYPWVDIGEYPPKEFSEKAENVSGHEFSRLLEENQEVLELIDRNYDARERLQWIVDEFYGRGTEQTEGRLTVITGVGRYGEARIVPQEALVLEAKVSREVLGKRLGAYQEAMRQFTVFLRERYLDPATEEKEQAYREFLRAMEDLRARTHEEMEREFTERIASNPKPTEAELRVGAFKEALEPQVRDAIFEFFRKGYTTSSSGFYGGGRQAVDGPFVIDDETRRKLGEIGVKVENAYEVGLPGHGDGWSRVEFRPEKADRHEIKSVWDAVAMLLPEKAAPAAPSASGHAYEFRKEYGRDRFDIELESLMGTREAKRLDPDTRARIQNDMKRGEWDFIDMLQERDVQDDIEEYDRAAREFFEHRDITS